MIRARNDFFCQRVEGREMEGYSLLMQTMLASAATFIGVLLFNRSHRREFRVAAFVALALFVAQIGAIAHSYTHQPSTGTSTYQKIANNHEFCADCLNFAPLLAAAGTPALLPVSLQFTQSPPPPAPPASFLDHRSYLAFRSRAPPVTR